MGEGVMSKRFVFTNRADDLYTLLGAIIGFLEGTGKVDDAARFKIKVVLTELLTNAIKHSGCTDSFIDIAITGREVCIVKVDPGNTFALKTDGVKLEWPLPGRHIMNQTKRIYGDHTFTLMAKVENNCSVSFFIEEQEPSPLPLNAINNLPEHFGLMIITKACDSFRYYFDIENCTNKFIAVIMIE